MIPKIANAIVRGEIRLPSDDPMLLSQDMLEVELPTGVFLDVGWFPEHDPQGEYVIMAFIDPDNLLCEPFVTRDSGEVLAVLHQWSGIFSQLEYYLSSSETTYPPRTRAYSYA